MSICPSCHFYLKGSPPICNAFHVPGVVDCGDFILDPNSEKQIFKELIVRINSKIDEFLFATGTRPQYVLLSRPTALFLWAQLATEEELNICSPDPARDLTIQGIKILRSLDVSDDFIGVLGVL